MSRQSEQAEYSKRLMYREEDMRGFVMLPIIGEPPLSERNPYINRNPIRLAQAQPAEDPDIELEQPDLSEEEADILHASILRLLEEDQEEPQLFSLLRQFADVPKAKRSHWAALAKIQAATQEKINRQIKAWENGNAPYDTTQRIASILREGALQAAQLGRLEKGQEGSLSKAEQAAVRSYMNEQKRYLKGVNRYMRQTLDKHPIPKNASPAERAARDAKARDAITHAASTLKEWRLPLYVNSLQGVYEKARARFALRIYPRSGDTQCMMNCYCRLEWGEDDQGTYVNWILGQPREDHCSDCPELAAGSPYRQGSAVAMSARISYDQDLSPSSPLLHHLKHDQKAHGRKKGGGGGAPPIVTRPGYGQGTQVENSIPGASDGGAKTNTRPPIDYIRTDPAQPTVLLMMGAGGSGKSTVLAQITDGNDRWDQVNPDRFKPQIPGYNPKDPNAVHEESSVMAYHALRESVSVGRDIIWDVTGTSKKVPAELEAMRAAGYKVRTVHVSVDRPVAQAANALRERTVPPHFIDAAFRDMPAAKARMSGISDTMDTLDNNWNPPGKDDWGSEPNLMEP